MIIDKKKNLYKELLRIHRSNKEKNRSFMEYDGHTIHNVFMNSGFESFKDFKTKYRGSKFKEILNKPVYNNDLFMKTFKAGIVKGTDLDFWLEKSILTRYDAFINESVNTTEKCSFIYACELVRKNEKIFYVIDDENTFKAVINFVNNNKVNHKIIEKVCFNVFNMDDYFYIFLDLMLLKRKSSLVEDDKKRYELYNFFFNSDYKSLEFSKEAIDKFKKEKRTIFPYKDDEEKEMYEQVYTALSEYLDKIYPFLSEQYSIEEDVFLNMQKGENFILASENNIHSYLIIQCARFFYCYIEHLQSLTKVENAKKIIIPHLIIPAIENITLMCLLKNSYLPPYNNAFTFYYGNQENYLFKMNTGFYFKHKSGTLYEVSSFFEKNITVDISKTCSCRHGEKQPSFLFEK